MKIDDHGYMSRVAHALIWLSVIIVGLVMANVVTWVKLDETNDRIDKIEAVLRADAKVGVAQLEFNRAVTAKLEPAQEQPEEIPVELDLAKLAVEYAEAINNAQPVQ